MPIFREQAPALLGLAVLFMRGGDAAAQAVPSAPLACDAPASPFVRATSRPIANKTASVQVSLSAAPYVKKLAAEGTLASKLGLLRAVGMTGLQQLNDPAIPATQKGGFGAVVLDSVMKGKTAGALIAYCDFVDAIEREFSQLNYLKDRLETNRELLSKRAVWNTLTFAPVNLAFESKFWGIDDNDTNKYPSAATKIASRSAVLKDYARIKDWAAYKTFMESRDNRAAIRNLQAGCNWNWATNSYSWGTPYPVLIVRPKTP